jgi:hypothetical protein
VTGAKCIALTNWPRALIAARGTSNRLRLAATRVRPNRSLEPTRYGRQRKPGLRCSVHYLSPCLHCLPTRSAQLER